MNIRAIYKNLTHTEPVEVTILETLPTGWAWCRFPDGKCRRVKRSSLWRPS